MLLDFNLEDDQMCLRLSPRERLRHCYQTARHILRLNLIAEKNFPRQKKKGPSAPP